MSFGNGVGGSFTAIEAVLSIVFCSLVLHGLKTSNPKLILPSLVYAILFLAHKSTGPNKNSYSQSLGSRQGNFYKAPELDMKYPQLSSGEGKKH